MSTLLITCRTCGGPGQVCVGGPFFRTCPECHGERERGYDAAEVTREEVLESLRWAKGDDRAPYLAWLAEDAS